MAKVFVLIQNYPRSPKESLSPDLKSVSAKKVSDNLTTECHEYQDISESDPKINVSIPDKKRSFIVLCDICKKTFASIFNLKRHMKDIHTIDPHIVKVQNFVCQLCNRQFINLHLFKFHVQTVHPDEHAASKQPLMFASPGDSAHMCKKCDQRFSSIYYLRRHKLKEHKLKGREITKHGCPICHGLFTKKDIFIHFEKTHDMKLNTSQLEFPTLSAFLTWKENMEIETKSKFVKEQGQPKRGNNYYYFRCNRSGNFQSQGQGKRNLKAKGSNKINGYCPASIKVTEMKDGKCVATYLKSHIGHEADLGHLPLSYSERQYLANKIAAKVPFKQILDEVQNSVPESGLQRLHLITRKDLHNVKQSFFQFKSRGKHKNNSIAVDAFVKKMENEHLFLLPKKSDESNQNLSLHKLPEKPNDLNKSNDDSYILSKGLKVSNIDLPVLPKLLNNESYKDSSALSKIPNESNKDVPVLPAEPNDSSEDSCMLLEDEEPNKSNDDSCMLLESNEISDPPTKCLDEKRWFTLPFNERKKTLKKQYLELIRSVSTSEELDTLESTFISIKKTLDAMRKSSGSVNYRSINLQN